MYSELGATSVHCPVLGDVPAGGEATAVGSGEPGRAVATGVAAGDAGGELIPVISGLAVGVLTVTGVALGTGNP